MKNILRIEELCMFGISLYSLWWLKAEWWWYPALLLAPDIGMLGYLINNKAGAICYNLFHHKGAGVLIFLTGVVFQNVYPMLAGIILFGHSSMDRLFGYGLKYFKGFRFTHLGIIGKNNETDNS